MAHALFGIHIGKARAITGSPRAIDRFVLWLQKLAWTYPAVTEFVIGNEPNPTRFWQPQFDRRGRNVSGIAFAAFLARSYDALKDVNLNIKVVGVGLAARQRPSAREEQHLDLAGEVHPGARDRLSADGAQQADHGRVRPTCIRRATATRCTGATGGRTRASRT